ncbi:hypothetical protein [Porphyrobacter sp. ULC335]|uniref:hypothetical protein n=1 Tax=Porphyrobacter sp. ULC335 TaxID=2854260 RepID=UPI00221FA92B|nr:hypothetical protein [Porphyrobacter sp. ULC335]UYV15993.1 hypothetical protein KVF90_01160 [Porphyrobacter sp. ULC335]
MPPALKRMETGLSSNATPALPCFRHALSALTLGLAPVCFAPLAAQDDTAATASPSPAADPAATPAPAPVTAPPQRINVLVTVPRGEVNQAQLQECRDDSDAGTISGEIVVCREVGSDGTGLTGSRAESQKRYAEETALKGAPRAPEMFGIPDNGKGIGFGGVPPPALMIDVAALPKAPSGSDADRIAQGLPPLGQDGELSEEQEKARREAAGIKTTVPPRPKKKGG